MNAGNIEIGRDQLSVGLIEETGPARSAVAFENDRVEALLASEPTGMDREAPGDYDGNTALDQSREIIRNNTITGIDDLAVDAHLKLRGEDCILPPLFQELHRQAEEQAGGEVPFLKWMTDHATDEQLTNVWQWHDSYLHNLDSDSAFQERIQSIKAKYGEGMQQAIAEQALHPAMAVDQAKMESTRIVHGSPFSPKMAVSLAYANRATGVIQMREGISDFALFHELSHTQKGGLFKEFNEGMTDLVAAEVYNRTHPDEEPVDPHGLVYDDQVATLDSINRLSGNKLGTFEASRFYAGPDNYMNSIYFLARADETIGLPILLPILQLSKQLREGVAAFNESEKQMWAQWFVRQQTAIFESAMLDSQGNRIARTTQEVAERLLSPEVQGKYNSQMAAVSLTVIAETHKLLQAP